MLMVALLKDKKQNERSGGVFLQMHTRHNAAYTAAPSGQGPLLWFHRFEHSLTPGAGVDSQAPPEVQGAGWNIHTPRQGSGWP